MGCIPVALAPDGGDPQASHVVGGQAGDPRGHQAHGDIRPAQGQLDEVDLEDGQQAEEEAQQTAQPDHRCAGILRHPGPHGLDHEPVAQGQADAQQAQAEEVRQGVGEGVEPGRQPGGRQLGQQGEEGQVDQGQEEEEAAAAAQDGEAQVVDGHGGGQMLADPLLQGLVAPGEARNHDALGRAEEGEVGVPRPGTTTDPPVRHHHGVHLGPLQVGQIRAALLPAHPGLGFHHQTPTLGLLHVLQPGPGEEVEGQAGVEEQIGQEAARHHRRDHLGIHRGLELLLHGEGDGGGELLRGGDGLLHRPDQGRVRADAGAGLGAKAQEQGHEEEDSQGHQGDAPEERRVGMAVAGGVDPAGDRPGQSSQPLLQGVVHILPASQRLHLVGQLGDRLLLAQLLPEGQGLFVLRHRLRVALLPGVDLGQEHAGLGLTSPVAIGLEDRQDLLQDVPGLGQLAVLGQGVGQLQPDPSLAVGLQATLPLRQHLPVEADGSAGQVHGEGQAGQLFLHIQEGILVAQALQLLLRPLVPHFRQGEELEQHRVHAQPAPLLGEGKLSLAPGVEGEIQVGIPQRGHDLGGLPLQFVLLADGPGLTEKLDGLEPFPLLDQGPGQDAPGLHFDGRGQVWLL